MGNKPIGFFCGSTANGGLERNLVKLANLLAGEGLTVKFFTAERAPYLELIDSEIQVFQVVKHKKYLDFKAATSYGKMLKAERVEKVIFRDNKDLDVLVWCKKLKHPDLQLFFWQAMQLGISKKDFYHSLKFNSLAKWVATLNGLKQQAIENTKINPAKVDVIPLPLNLQKFTQSSPLQEEARAQIGLATDKKIMGIVGRIDPKKGQQFVMEQLPKLPNWHLLIVGEPTRGEYENHLEELKEISKNLDLSGRVTFLPFTQDLLPIYRSLDLLVMASQAETFGAVTIEAMASGTAVLGTNAGGTPELLEAGNLGWLYEPNDETSFLKQLQAIENNIDAVKEKAILAKEAAVRKYDSSVIAKKFIELLAQNNGL